METMNKNVWWAWAIKNSVCVICWVVLAIVFNKWWIALFATLFVNSVKGGVINRYYRVCDECGKHSPYATTYEEALKKAKEAGWVYYEKDNEDYCPNCQKKLSKRI